VTDSCGFCYFFLTSMVTSKGHNHFLRNTEYFTPYHTLRRCATNQKVAGSIPAGVIGIFIEIKSFRSHYGPGVDSDSNRNEYQEHFLGVKAAGAKG